ncbi:MAG: ATP-binding protein [Solobacterium sp.]|nr:ATP-binding protein [Solobacterium sp.]
MSDYSYSESNILPIRYVGAYTHLRGSIINEIVRNEEYKNICVMMLKLFDKGISDILTLPGDIGYHTVSYLRHDRLGYMPLSTYGDGVKRALVLANEIAGARGGILLIDEIETSIHKQYHDDIFRFVTKACLQYNVQLFITTHSLEAVDGILKTQDYDKSPDNDSINVITLRKEGNKTLSRSLSGAEVYKNRVDFGFDVRL